MAVAADITPTAQDIADFIPRRTVGGSGIPTGTFGTTTSPTDTQVVRVGASVAAEVLAAAPDLPDVLIGQAKRIAALGAAAQLELSYWPEDRDTIAKELEARYVASLQRLAAATELITGKVEPGEGGSGAAGDIVASPQYNYPDLLGDRAPGGEWPFQLWPTDLWLYPNL